MADDQISDMASKGGKARDKALSTERKREIALMGVEARRLKAMDTTLPEVTHGDPSHPLTISGIEIPCFVLSDGRRVQSEGRGRFSGKSIVADMHCDSPHDLALCSVKLSPFALRKYVFKRTFAERKATRSSLALRAEKNGTECRSTLWRATMTVELFPLSHTRRRQIQRPVNIDTAA